MKKRYVAVCLIITVLCSVLAFILGNFMGSLKWKPAIIMKMIEQHFALPYDEEQLEDTVAKFMVYALEDPYSEYMTKEESTVFFEAVSGIYKGIGAVMGYNSNTDEIYIEEIEKNGPADKAGMKPGDVILYVDEMEMSYENYDRVFYYIKGISDESPDDSTAMKFKILREGEELEFSVKREELVHENVETEINDDILYIKLSDFSEKAPSAMKEALEKHKEFSGMVLDLRGNGGGDLDSLIEVAELLLPPGILLTTEDAKGRRIEYRIKDDEYTDVPLAVLVNGKTASASEVFVACVKETGRGCLVGETTYGKGLVQTTIPFSDGSMLKLTIEKYYTSEGNYINEVGIEPDIIVEDYDKQTTAAFEYVKKRMK